MSLLPPLLNLLSAWLALAACLPLAWFLVSRLVLHPLAQYPGPWLAALTDLYAAYHAWMGDIHEDMLRCHLKYGERVRYGPNRLLFNTEQALKDINGPNKNVAKSQAYTAMVHRAHNVFTSIDKREHARRRKLLAARLSEAAIDSYEPTMLEVVDGFVESLKIKEQDSDRTVDVSVKCGRLTFDLMSKVVFGLDYDLVKSPRSRSIVPAMHTSNARVSTLFQANWLRWRPLDKRLFKNAIAARGQIIGFVNDVVKRKLKSNTGQEDSSIFARLMGAKDAQTGASFDVKELASESTTLMFAGTDTTAAALAGIFYRLRQNRNALAQATSEVRNKFPAGVTVKSGPELSDCLFLRACIDEALRLHPPAGSALWREALEGGVTVDGEHIPEGCDVGVSIYAIQRSPEYFPNPDTFDPSRMQGGKVRSAYNPFSLGPRGCLGKAFAQRELMLTVARVLQRLDIEGESHGYDGEQELGFRSRDHISATTYGPMLTFREACS